MGRHADRRTRVTIPVIAGGAAAALVGAILSVQVQATAVAPRLSDNLVTNSTFEAGTQGWNTQSASRKLTLGAGRDSRRSAKVTALVNRAILLLNDAPNVVASATEGATYIATAWVRADSPSMKVSLRFREVAGGTLVAKGQSTVTTAGTGWKQIRSEFVVRGANHQLAVQVIAADVAKGASMSVDDIDVREVLTGSEPDTGKTGTPVPSPSKSESAPPEPAPTKSETPPPAPITSGDTLFGSSVYQGAGDSFQSALARQTRLYGVMDIVRVFHSGLPQAWTGSALSSFAGPVAVSFKALPSQVLSGTYDAQLKAWFAASPRDRVTWWTYFHEPEDDIERGSFTASDYRKAWQHISALADTAGNGKLRATLVLMCWSLETGSGRDWHDYYPGSSAIDVLGFDCYNQLVSKGIYPTPESQFDQVIKASNETGKPFAIAELGSTRVSGDSGKGRAAWLSSLAKFMVAHDAQFVSYFDSPITGVDYRLDESASQTAWRDVVQAS